MKKPTPVDIISKKFGSQAEFARAIGVVPSAITNWNQPRSIKGGRDGQIPDIHFRKIKKEARKRGIEIALEELVNF